MTALLALLLLGAGPVPSSEGLPPSVTVYTNVQSPVWRSGLQRAFEDTWPTVHWRVLAAENAGKEAPVETDAWLLHVEEKEEDVTPDNRMVLYALKTPRGQAQAETRVGTSSEGSWLMPLGVCGALACGPCPACAGPGLAVAYGIGALAIAGPGALGEAIGGGIATFLATCLLWPCMLIPPGCLIWPLEASKALRPLANHHKLHRTAAGVLPQLVNDAFTEGKGLPPPADTPPGPGTGDGPPSPPPPDEPEPTLSL